jgi:prepilin-type N-terminal cleavage/methylation domain-containing protein
MGFVMRRGFTIVELLVAIGILVALLTASGVIFSMAVDAQRAASATSEITEKLQAMRDQLDNDFSHLAKTGPLAIWFELNPVDDDGDGAVDRYERFDQIMFFDVGGNFDTTRQYDDDPDPAVNNLVTVSGNSARVYYGHADRIDYANRTAGLGNKALVEGYQFFRTLARRQHVLTADLNLSVFPDITDSTTFENSFVPLWNDYFEYDVVGDLTQWESVFDYVDAVNGPVNSEQVLETCFDNVEGRAGIDLKEPLTLHMLMCQGVGSFKIQLSYEAGGQVRWYPSADPDGDGDASDSNFSAMDSFGLYFNMPSGVYIDKDGDGTSDWLFAPGGFYPKALKFTFRLYDSRGIFRDGKTFTHIVNLD